MLVDKKPKLEFRSARLVDGRIAVEVVLSAAQSRTVLKRASGNPDDPALLARAARAVLFGKPVSAEARLSVNVPDKLAERFKKYCVATGGNVSLKLGARIRRIVRSDGTRTSHPFKMFPLREEEAMAKGTTQVQVILNEDEYRGLQSFLKARGLAKGAFIRGEMHRLLAKADVGAVGPG